MQPLELNLSTRPFRNNTLLWLSYSLIVLLLALLSVWNFQSYQTHRDLFTDLKTVVSGIQAESGELNARVTQARGAISGFDIGNLGLQTRKANEFIRWKAFSWTRLFNQLQDIQPYDVQMVAVRPTFRKKRVARAQQQATEETEAVPVNVEGLAKTMKDFFDLERALVADPHFDRIEPMATDTDDTTGEIVFALRFLYTPNIEQEEEETDEPGPGSEEQVPAEPAQAAGSERAEGRPSPTDGGAG